MSKELTFNDVYKRGFDNQDFEFCSNKKCPLRRQCLRSARPPFSSEYWSTGGKYDKGTNQCGLFIKIEE